jgi:hypothetical protein
MAQVCSDFSGTELANCNKLASTGAGIGQMLSNLQDGLIGFFTALVFLAVLVIVVVGIVKGILYAFRHFTGGVMGHTGHKGDRY